MLADLRELWAFRELLFTLVERDIRVRYKNSVLGFFWSFLNPLATTAVMTVVFGTLMNNNIKSFSAYVLAAYLPYTFFQQSVLDSSQSVLGALPLIRKVYFPRELLPLSIVVSNFIHLILGFGVFFLLLLITYAIHPGNSPFQVTTLYLPVLLCISFFLSTGVGLFVSALNVFYEDVKYVVGVLLYLLFFLCPVMYFIERIGSTNAVAKYPWLFKLYSLNPVADLCVAYRKILLAPQVVMDNMERPVAPYPLNWSQIGYSAVFSLVVFFLGYRTFSRLKGRFVERV